MFQDPPLAPSSVERLLKKVGEVTTLLLRKVLFRETSEHRTKAPLASGCRHSSLDCELCTPFR